MGRPLNIAAAERLRHVGMTENDFLQEPSGFEWLPMSDIHTSTIIWSSGLFDIISRWCHTEDFTDHEDYLIEPDHLEQAIAGVEQFLKHHANEGKARAFAVTLRRLLQSAVRDNVPVVFLL